MGRTIIASVAALICLLHMVNGCTSERAKSPVITPMAIVDPSVQRGQAVFDKHCYSCHLRGTGGMAPKLNNKPLPKFLIKFQVRHGLGVMPAFSEEQISDPELQDLANYVAALRAKGL